MCRIEKSEHRIVKWKVASYGQSFYLWTSWSCLLFILSLVFNYFIIFKGVYIIFLLNFEFAFLLIPLNLLLGRHYRYADESFLLATSSSKRISPKFEERICQSYSFAVVVLFNLYQRQVSDISSFSRLFWTYSSFSFSQNYLC